MQSPKLGFGLDPDPLEIALYMATSLLDQRDGFARRRQHPVLP